MSVIKGDFIGFTYDNIHSSELGLMRISDGSRYTENLLPNISDKVVQPVGADGTYYVDSFYTQKPFTINVGFDSVTETQLRKIRQLFGEKGIHTLIFDEWPYKIYKVKTTGTPNLKYVAFDDDRINYGREESNKVYTKDQLYKSSASFFTDRIYKGEGNLSFVAYTPFARSRYKFLNYYDEINIPEWRAQGKNTEAIYNNLNAWLPSVNFVSSWYKQTINGIDYQIDVPTQNGVLVRNFGDIDTPFKLIFKFENSVPAFTIKYYDKNNELKSLSITEINNLFNGDVGFQINSDLHLIEGIKEDGTVSGTLYNKYIIAGDFFNIDANDDFKLISFEYEGNQFAQDIEIKYDYLFF